MAAWAFLSAACGDGEARERKGRGGTRVFALESPPRRRHQGSCFYLYEGNVEKEGE
jgi:hypothetical protein